MENIIKVALIGLDTSHTVEFARRMAAPDCREELKVGGLKAVSCLRYPSKYYDEQGQDKRQAQLEAWGVPVVTDFDQAVRDCDAIMLEANDPADHLPWFRRCAACGKPVFLDKPPADTLDHAREIFDLAARKNIPLFSASAMRFAPQALAALKQRPDPRYAHIYGALGHPPPGGGPGELLIWYGVHTFELMQLAMGSGAETVFVKEDRAGLTVCLEFPEKRRGIVELTHTVWLYGGTLRTGEEAASFVIPVPFMVHDTVTIILKQVRGFFSGGPAPVRPAETLAVMALLEAGVRSLATGAPEEVRR